MSGSSRLPDVGARFRLLLALVASLLFPHPQFLRADGVCPDPGHLQQTVLVILDFPPEGRPGVLTAAEEAHIASQLDAASNFLWTNSNQSLRVDFHRIKVLRTLTATDYEDYGGAGSAAKYTPEIHQALQNRDVTPKDFAGVVMIYRPTNAPAGLFNNTWIWFNDEFSSHKRNPGFSSVVFNNTNLLSEIVVHEYLHQLDHRFERESGNTDPAQQGFMNPDNRDLPDGQRLALLLGITFPTPVSYYEAILKYYVGPDKALHVVNYRWLEGIRGVFYGGEPRILYDFADTDSALVHVAGDNISQVQSGNPTSFWFRALPGHTAAFRTQTAFGRYKLQTLAFNYEIAPGDYSFEVRLVYCDIKGKTVEQRIDDGLYTLGRQKFRSNRKRVTVNMEVEDFQIVFRKGNQLSGPAASDDWLLLGKIELDLEPAP